MYTHIRSYIYVYIYIHTHMYVCVYIYIYIVYLGLSIDINLLLHISLDVLCSVYVLSYSQNKTQTKHTPGSLYFKPTPFSMKHKSATFVNVDTNNRRPFSSLITFDTTYFIYSVCCSLYNDIIVEFEH